MRDAASFLSENVTSLYIWKVDQRDLGMDELSISFDRGTILIRGPLQIPNSSYDERSKCFRAQALHYTGIKSYLEQSLLDFNDQVENLVPCPELRRSRSSSNLRGYQQKALKTWEDSGRRGVIVLPTGAGKTLIGVKAIESVNAPAMVVVPTLDLMYQWIAVLEEEFGLDIGVIGGGESITNAITVATYDSAYLKAPHLGNAFSLLIFDEVHHLPAEGYRQIAEMFTAPYRMGLTATYEREDRMEKELPRLIGGKVFEIKPSELAGTYLAPYSIEKRIVDLTDEERGEYETQRRIFTSYLRSKRISLNGAAAFRRFIMSTGRSREARNALLARNRALEIALNSQSKIEALRMILSANEGIKTLIFTQHNSLVHKISRNFLIPSITHKTEKTERNQILDEFKNGTYRAIVTSKVLDEGVDIPDAELGIVLSGTGSSREFTQRLGRLLRMRDKKKARLVEIISRETSEGMMSSRRKSRLEK